MSLTSIIRSRDDIQKFLLGSISHLPEKPKFGKCIASNSFNLSLIGTAFDYAFRFEVLRLYPHAVERQWIAEIGARLILNSEKPFVRKWRKNAQKTIIAAKMAREKYSTKPDKNNLEELVDLCFRLSTLDRVFRQFSLPTESLPRNGLMPGADHEDVQEVISLLRNSRSFLKSSVFKSSKSILLNPIFGEYSSLVGGADADIITSNALIDLKTSFSPQVRETDLAQISGYLMLLKMYNIDLLGKAARSYQNLPNVRKIGLFYARYGISYLFPADLVQTGKERLLAFADLINTRPVFQQDPFLNLRLVGAARSGELRKHGINTIEELSKTALIVHGDPLKIIDVIKGIKLSRLSQTATDYLEHRIRLKEDIDQTTAIRNFDFNDEVYLDIETTGLMTESQIWLIGMYFAKEKKLVQLFAEDPSKERRILKDLAELLSAVNGQVMIFSGSDFDYRLIRERLRRHNLISKVNLPQFTDVLKIIRQTARIPSNNNLKEMAAWTGYAYKHPELSGGAMPILYAQYLLSDDQVLRKSLLEYNEDDIMSLKYVVDFIRKWLQEGSN